MFIQKSKINKSFLSAQQVSVAYGKGPFINTVQALSSIDLSIIKGKSILVKPNIGRQVGPGKGINTHPEAIAGVIEVLLDNGAKKITIGESPIVGINAFKAFETAGLKTVINKYKCDLIDLNSGSAKILNIPDSWIINSTKISSHLLDFDLLLSLPVAKCHMHTGVTLGMKNLKGCLYRREKIRYHQLEPIENMKKFEKTLDFAISDLATVLLPDITVIDGYIGMEGLGPSGGDPVQSDFAVASKHPVGADVIGCMMMGKDPAGIPHLRYIAERIGSPIRAEEYTVTPTNYLDHRTVYKDPPSDISLEYPDVELCDIDSCSACLSTIMFFLKRFNEDMTQYVPDDQKLCLAIGKGINDEDLKKGTILVGNCAKKNSGNYIHVKGCPPVATRIYKSITGKEPSENEPDIT